MHDFVRGLTLYGRLFWRPRSLALLWLWAMAIIGATLRLGEAASVASLVLVGASGGALAIGATCAVLRGELLAAPVVRLWPGVFAQLRSGAAVVGLMAMLCAATIAAAFGSATAVTLPAAISLMWFAIGNAMTLLPSHRYAGTAVVMLSISSLYIAPTRFADLAQRHGPVAVGLSLVIAAGLLRYESRAASRLWHGASTRATVRSESTRATREFDGAPALQSLAGASAIAGWVRAAMTSAPRLDFDRHTKWSWLALRLGAINATILFLIGVQTYGIFGFTLVGQGLQLGNTLLYPMTRIQRAHVRFACACIESALLSLVAFVALTAFRYFNVPHVGIGDEQASGRLPVAFTMLALFAFAPIAQLSRAVTPLKIGVFRARTIFTMIAFVLSYELGSRLTYTQTSDMGAWAPYAALLAGGGLMHGGLYALMLRWHSQGDLLPPR